MFVVNDNNKIKNTMNRLLYIYEKSLKKKKLNYFLKYKLIIELMKKTITQYFYFSLKKQDIYNKLYDTKKRENNLNEIIKKTNEEQNKQCTFSPKIKSKFNPIHNYCIITSTPLTMRNYFAKNKIFLEESKGQSTLSGTINNNNNNNIEYNSLYINSNRKRNKKNNLYENKSNDNIIKIPVFNVSNHFKNTKEKNHFRKISSNVKKTNDNNINKVKTENNLFQPFNLTSIQENLSLLFSSRLKNKKEQKIENKTEKIENMKNKILKQINISNSTITNDKVSNYITISRTEHLSTLNLEDKNKNDKRKSYSNDFNNFKRKSNNINSIKNTYYFSQRNEISYERYSHRINNTNNLLNNYLESQDDTLKKLSFQNSKNKTATLYFEGNIIKNNKNNLKIVSEVVNEKFNQNENESNRNVSNNNSNQMITLQTISDSKLFDLASKYVKTDESLERFRYLNKIGKKKGSLKFKKFTGSPIN